MATRALCGPRPRPRGGCHHALGLGVGLLLAWAAPRAPAWGVEDADQAPPPAAEADGAVLALELRSLDVGSDGALEAIVGARGAPEAPPPRLSPGELTVSVDGAPVDPPAEVQTFGASGAGLTVLLAVDTSGTMRAAMPELKAGLARFAKALRPGVDAVALGSIGDDWRLVQGFTTDPGLLGAALEGLEANAKTTALFESVDLGLQTLAAAPDTLPRRRLMVVVSDGLNEKAGRTAQECISRARGLGLQVHSLLYLATRTERYLSAKGALEKISRDSGGMTTTIDRPDALGDALGALRSALSDELVVSLDLKERAIPGGAHRLGIEARERAVEGSFTAPPLPVAYAPPPAPASPLEDPRVRWAGLAGLIFILGIAALVIRRKRAAPLEELPPDPPAFSPSAPTHLRVLSGLEDLPTLPLPRDGGSVGFDAHNDVVLPDASVSGRHARLISLGRGALAIVDEGSTNGTFVDERPVGAEPTPLALGQRVRFGLVVTVCEAHGPDTGARS